MIVENMNQRTIPGGGDTFCLATCVVTVGRFYGRNASIADMVAKNAVASDGTVTNTNVYFKMSANKTIDYSKIKTEINNNHPVIIVGATSLSPTHFVVADSYTGAGSDASHFKVMDPWTGTHKKLTECTLKSIDAYRTCTL